MNIYILLIQNDHSANIIGSYTDIFAAYREVSRREEVSMSALNLSGTGDVYSNKDGATYTVEVSTLTCDEDHEAVEVSQSDFKLIKKSLASQFQSNDDKVRLGSLRGIRPLTEEEKLSLISENKHIESLYSYISSNGI